MHPKPFPSEETLTNSEALPIVQRSLVPEYDWTYNAYIIGKTPNHVQIELDVHYGQAGIQCGRQLFALLNILQNRLKSLFAKSVNVSPELICSVYRAHGNGGFHLGNANVIYLGALPPPDFHIIGATFVCEAVEIFARIGQKDWDSSWSHGEALSRLIGNAFVNNQLNGFQTVPKWLNTPNRPDWVSQSVHSETDLISIGCAVAFIHFLHDVLGFPLEDIVNTPGNSLELKYERLTGKRGGYHAMMDILNKKFPIGTNVPDTLAMDSPFLH